MLCVRICFAGVSFHDELHCVFVRHAIVGCGVAHCGDVSSTHKSADVRVIACMCMNKVICFHRACLISIEQCFAFYRTFTRSFGWLQCSTSAAIMCSTRESGLIVFNSMIMSNFDMIADNLCMQVLCQ